VWDDEDDGGDSQRTERVEAAADVHRATNKEDTEDPNS